MSDYQTNKQTNDQKDNPSGIRATCGHPVSWDYHLKNKGRPCQECKDKIQKKRKHDRKEELSRSNTNG